MKEEEKNIQEFAREVILTEASALQIIAGSIGEPFVKVVKMILHSKGRVVVTGIGKSALIAQKIVATLNSTGTPALFMHAADAIHGDLGLVLEDDVVLCLSKSGNTPEIKVLVPILKNMKNTLVAMVANKESYLAQHADHVLLTEIPGEACPNNLVPTTSTTAQLVMGDALAVCLLRIRGFTSEDFARVHPGGSLGKKLYLRVSDLLSADRKPQVSADDDLRKVILEISGRRLGATAVTDEQGKILGVITDGDLRRMLERGDSSDTVSARNIMSVNPKTIQPGELAINAFYLMEQFKITTLLVEEDGIYVGMIHLHDILREGIV
jgi:arabinose-5-phosphate isomerase